MKLSGTYLIVDSKKNQYYTFIFTSQGQHGGIKHNPNEMRHKYMKFT